jgi:chromosome segregation ATPase
MNNNRGIAIVPLIVAIVLVGVAGFSTFSWVKTRNQAQADKEVAEQREKEFKAALDDAQQEAEDNAKKAADLGEKLTKTEEAMKLAEEKAQQDAEEKAAMLAELELKLEEEAKALAEASERSEKLEESIGELEKSISEARDRENMLRASLNLPMVAINPKATAGLASVAGAAEVQRSGLDAIKSMLASSGPMLNTRELDSLVRSFEAGLIDSERAVSGLSRDLVASGEFSASSTVGQAVADLQQSTVKQRALLNSLKRLLADSGETIDRAQVEGLINDIELLMAEMTARQASLEQVLQASAGSGQGGDSAGSAAIAQLEQAARETQNQLANLRRQLAQAEAEKQAAIARQQELERLSIEIRYDIDYQFRSVTYQRRLHSMYDSVANPVQER